MMQMSFIKPELVKYITPRVGKSYSSPSSSGKEFHLFLIVVQRFLQHLV